jgi:hypothetical protein
MKIGVPTIAYRVIPLINAMLEPVSKGRIGFIKSLNDAGD